VSNDSVTLALLDSVEEFLGCYPVLAESDPAAKRMGVLAAAMRGPIEWRVEMLDVAKNMEAR
jgi:hypothetical protein